MDAGRALLPGARARAPRRGRRQGRGLRRARSPPTCASATRVTPGTMPGSSTTSRSTSGASPCRSPLRRSTRSAEERSLLYLSLAGLRRGRAGALRPAAPALPDRARRGGRRRGGAAAAAHAPLLVPAHRQLGSRAGDRRARRGDPRARARARAGCRSGSVRSRCSRSRATAPGSRSSRWAGFALRYRSRVPVDALRDRYRGRAARAPPLHDARARPARAARERLRAVGRHLVGIHRGPLPGRARRARSARTSASSAAASGTRRSSSSAASSRSCCSSGAGARRASAATTLMTRRVPSSPSATCSPRRSSAPSGSSSSSCRWPRGARARGGASSRLGSASATVRSRAGSPDSSNPDAWIGRPELPALVRCAAVAR